MCARQGAPIKKEIKSGKLCTFEKQDLKKACSLIDYSFRQQEPIRRRRAEDNTAGKGSIKTDTGQFSAVSAEGPRTPRDVRRIISDKNLGLYEIIGDFLPKAIHAQEDEWPRTRKQFLL